jgi:hypothetical protein
MIEFESKLYAGIENWNWNINASEGGEIWRTPNGLDWTRVITQGFNDPINGEITSFAVFFETLYASTWSYTSAHGAEIWRSSTGDSTDWHRVLSNGLGNANNRGVVTMKVYNDHLYAGTYNTVDGATIWRTSDGSAWSPIAPAGFDDPYNRYIGGLEAFNNYLYAGTYNYTNSDNPGAELWRCQVCDGSDWEQVAIPKGLGDTYNRSILSLVIFKNMLYATTVNTETGMEVWRTSDGSNWSQINPDGFGDSNNWLDNWDKHTIAFFKDRLFIGTGNSANGGEIWMYLHNQVYLPLVLR